MSIVLWQKLPERFLRMKFPAWNKLDHNVKRVVVELAKKQDFTCALCSRNHGLEVEHDHDPQEGPGDRYTVYNIRGLVCRGCNWHLRFYEAQESGEYFGWDNANCRISSRDYEDYICAYECRVSPLTETLLEQRMGSRNYWRRRLVLQKFDEWFYVDGFSGWRERWEENHKWDIRTPKRCVQVLIALMQFVIEQLKEDPNYQPPEKIFEILAKIRPIIEQAKASGEGASVARIERNEIRDQLSI